jgi:DNA-binding MarR family transcriptional regulator
VNEISTALATAPNLFDGESDAATSSRLEPREPLSARDKFPERDFPAIAKRIYAARRWRENALGIPRLFSDPAWDILLDVLINEGRLNRVSVSSACIASCVPATTALRWIATLEENGLIERRPDPADARRTFLSLTKKGRARTYAAILACIEAGTGGSRRERADFNF